MGLSLSARHLRVQLKQQGSGRTGARCLFDIDHLVLAAGQSVALYGPSGSGKTTLLNLLVGLQHNSGSRVVWTNADSRQQDIMQLQGGASDAWRLKHAGLVFQQFHLFATMTALENVLTPYRFDHWRCPPTAHRRAAELLALFGVDASAYAGQLSRGEQQRVAIARALVREPSVVVADEPTASLDPVTAGLVMDVLIAQCLRRDVTLIVATHDVTLASRFDRVLALKKGQLAPFAPPPTGHPDATTLQ